MTSFSNRLTEFLTSSGTINFWGTDSMAYMRRTLITLAKCNLVAGFLEFLLGWLHNFFIVHVWQTWGEKKGRKNHVINEARGAVDN